MLPLRVWGSKIIQGAWIENEIADKQLYPSTSRANLRKHSASHVKFTSTLKWWKRLAWGICFFKHIWERRWLGLRKEECTKGDHSNFVCNSFRKNKWELQLRYPFLIWLTSILLQHNGELNCRICKPRLTPSLQSCYSLWMLFICPLVCFLFLIRKDSHIPFSMLLFKCFIILPASSQGNHSRMTLQNFYF